MKKLIKELWLMVTLIFAASLVLIFSDLGQREGKKSEPRKYPSIAVMQISSTPLLDALVAGICDRLGSEGMLVPDRSNLKIFNPQGDFATANTVAREIISSPFDIVITASTPALQIFSKANVTSKKNHIFGGVTNPYGAGVGIEGRKPDQHPPYMAGIGTFQPVKRAFTIIRELNPEIKKVGVVRNPGEQCSEACMVEAREICGELKIELIDAAAGNTSEVSEAARSIISKGIEAIWIGGDTIATASSKQIISLAMDAGIPVFTNDPSDADSGALFGVGADYFTVGHYTADIAAAVLRGKKPSDFPIDNVIPEKFILNRDVLASLGGKYRITPEISKLLDNRDSVSGISTASTNTYAKKKEISLDLADIKKQGNTSTAELAASADVFFNMAKWRGRSARIAIINLVENSDMEDAENGVEAGLEASGLKKGIDYSVKKYCAQGDMSQLSQIIDAALLEKPDAVVTLSTAAMIAAAKKISDVPVIFTVASDPVKAGAFPDGKRPANFCGIHDDPPLDEILKMAIENNSSLSSVGIVYDASQINSMISAEKLRSAGQRQNIRILEATASSVTDLDSATRAVIQKGAKAIIISADNLANTGFSVIHKAASASGIPIYVSNLMQVKKGAAGGIGDDYRSWGRQSGILAAKVLAGASPSMLPIRPTDDRRRIEPSKTPMQLKKFSMALYSETEFAERCREGILEGLKQSGLAEGTDYELKYYNAQGDMSTLSSIMTTIRADRPDLLFVISTPSLQAAMRQTGSETKIVFTGVGDGVQAGAGKSERDHLPNVTGVTTSSDFDGMAAILKETLPGASAVGTLFTPAEINSEIYRERLKAALDKHKVNLVAVPVTSAADIAQAADELCRNRIQAVVQIVDNLTRPGFALISGKAAAASLPVYVFDSSQMKEGGVICVARDYYDAGIETAQKAVRILKGENPADIPFNNTRSEKLILNRELAEKYRLNLPESLKSRAQPFTGK